MNNYNPQEIKVRAWDESTKTMVYPSDNFSSADILKNYSVVMLYTNVKDVNGTDIYDGDIITNSWNDTQVVEPDTGRWRATLLKRTTSYWPAQYLHCTYMEWKVIGNMYETPKILEALK